MGALLNFLRRHFGFPVSSSDVTVTLGIVPISIVQNNPNRTQVSIFNLSATICYIAFNSGVTATNGIMLAANGGFVSFIAPDDGDLPGREIWGLAAAGAPTLYIVETGATA